MPLKRAVELQNTDIVKFLLESGVRPEADACLLHTAVKNQSSAIIYFLTPYCNINLQDEAGNTVLHYVNNSKMAKFLIEKGALADIRNNSGKLPYEIAVDHETEAYLKEEYFKLHPVTAIKAVAEEQIEASDWEKRFAQQVVTIQDLVPLDSNINDKLNWKLSCMDKEYSVTPRFVTSLAKKLKFSNTIFNYFSPAEVLERAAEIHPKQEFVATFDNHNNQILGIIERDKKVLPPSIGCKIFSEDPRMRKTFYENGVWKGELHLDESFNIPNSGEYRRRLTIHYPVDGIGSPCIYLALLRQVCSNGSVAQVSSFRTDIEINDESGTHLGRLLKSFSNQHGFSALEERVDIAQQTVASVNELMMIDNLMQEYVQDKNSYRKLHNRLYEIAGEPCHTYGTTSLSNIPAKKRALLPVNCAVNDLLNFCSELTTHHGNLLTSAQAFDIASGRTLAGEYDLEGMYRNTKKSPDFFLKDLKLSKYKTQEYFDREESLEVING